MIRFWQYDGTCQDSDVETNFFDLEPEQSVRDQMSKRITFSNYNEINTMP